MWLEIFTYIAVESGKSPTDSNRTKSIPFQVLKLIIIWKWFYMKGTKLLQDLDGFVKWECQSALMLEWFDMRCEDNIVCNFSRCFHKAPLMFPTSSVTWYKPDVNSFLFYGRSITHFVSGWRPTRFQCPPQSPWDQFGFWIGLDLGLESWGTLGLGTGLDWFHADYTEPRFCNFKDEELWT